MIKIGITGQSGFIGTHLYNTLRLQPEKYECIPFEDEFFQSDETMDNFVRKCDVIVHLAALNRHSDADILYKTNIELVQKLIAAMERTNNKPYVIMSSSLQEERDNLYGRSKREGRELFNQWADRNGACFTGLIIPNVFGPFGVPFYNSVVSTFSHQVVNELEPKIEVDAKLSLIYVGDLVEFIIGLTTEKDKRKRERMIEVEAMAQYKVSELLEKLKGYREIYQLKGVFPDLSDRFELCLFNTFRSYIPMDHFPVKYTKHADPRGVYVEAMKFCSEGQAAYSTTVPGITRGNHFHTRKVERFAVISGKASIKLRKYGSDEVFEHIIDGENPGYVDMPIWYAHNITNIGDTELLTMFWINEFYDPEDADTYFEEV